MCEPTTIAAVTLGASVAGTAVSVMGQMQAGEAAVDAHAANAQTAIYQQQDRLEAAEIEVAKSYTNFRRIQGTALARIGGSGISQTSFSDVLADSSAEAALERMSIRYTANKEAFYLGQQAKDQLIAGKNAGIETQYAVAGTVLKGVSSAASGFGSGGAYEPLAAQSAPTTGWDASVSYSSPFSMK